MTPMLFKLKNKITVHVLLNSYSALTINRSSFTTKLAML
jgi:hypothetical protein